MLDVWHGSGKLRQYSLLSGDWNESEAAGGGGKRIFLKGRGAMSVTSRGKSSRHAGSGGGASSGEFGAEKLLYGSGKGKMREGRGSLASGSGVGERVRGRASQSLTFESCTVYRTYWSDIVGLMGQVSLVQTLLDVKLQGCPELSSQVIMMWLDNEVEQWVCMSEEGIIIWKLQRIFLVVYSNV